MDRGHRQTILRLLGELPPLRTFTTAELRVCKSLPDAYLMTIHFSGKPRKRIEAETGIGRSHMSRILSGTRDLPDNKAELFYESCGNIYARQWKLYQAGFVIHPRELDDAEKAALFDEMRKAG